jgi:hypothetical protein
MQLRSDQILDIIRKETCNLIEGILETLENKKTLSSELTLADNDGRKFTILGFGEDVITVEPASGDDPFDISFKELKNKYMLPKDASKTMNK